jgi:competence protein ComEC
MPDTLTFEFMDVGMGDATLVKIRPDKQGYDTLWLVDFGEKGTPFEVAYKDAVRYLVKEIATNSTARGTNNPWNKKLPYVDVLILTHPDGDHYNKIPALVEESFPGFMGEELHFGKVLYGGRTAEYGKLLTTTLKGNVFDPSFPAQLGYQEHSTVANDGSVMPWMQYGKTNVYLLSVNFPTRYGPKNAKSLVLMFELVDGNKKWKVILPGDAEGKTENHIIDTFEDAPGFLNVWGVKLGHHGSQAGSSPEWVEATKPNTIFASGDFRWGHPYCSPICRFIDGGTLGKPFTGGAYYCCGKAQDRYDNPTTAAICMNLWYSVLTKAGEDLVESDELIAPVKPGKAIKGGYLNTWGVQWELTFATGKTPVGGVTGFVRPAKAQKIPPPFDCKKATAWLDFEPPVRIPLELAPGA